MLRPLTSLLHLAWLAVLWVALWGSATAANVIGGLVIAAGVLMAGRERRRSGQLVFRPLRALVFAGYFVVKLVQASAIVALEVVTPRNRIRTGIIAVPLLGSSDALVTIVADAISLTPGTLTVEVRADPPTLYVHVLHLHDVDKVRADVRRVETLAVRAFGTSSAVAGLDVDDTQTLGRPT
jgi:multicomponent Na+:H+ antiporter subunit E